MAKELYFQVAIKDVKESLDKARKEIEDWSRNNTIPLTLTVNLDGLRSQLHDLGSVYGENNKQVKQLAQELSEVSKNAKQAGDEEKASVDKAAQSVEQAKNKITSLNNALKDVQGISDKFAGKGFDTTVIDRYKEKLLSIRNELDKISNNGGVHPMNGLFTSEYLRQFDTSGIERNLRTQLSYYKQISTEFEKIDKLKAGLNDLLGKADPSKRSEIQQMIRDLENFQALVSRKGVNDARFMFGGADYKNQIANANVLIRENTREIKENEKATRKATTEQRKSINDAAIQWDKLGVKIRSLQEIRNRGKLLGLDTSEIDAYIKNLGRLRKEMYDIMNGARGGMSTGLTGLPGGLSAKNLLNNADVRRFFTQGDEAAKKFLASITQLVSEEERLSNAVRRSNDSLRSQSQVLNDLKSMALQYLSVWGAQSFVNNIIEKGGQLEQQRLSIQAILGDAAQARTLFEQIKALAPQSPFGIIDLDKMSKQLSAYGFEYHELYEWTKRLADISAATGTEVSRLALALGHVRAEGALSGYTLRQFSMGNIPLLEKLSEKIGVTKKEIREMVRRKDIGFDDVIGVLKDLTDEGGMFYKAQETMAEALNAKFKNLRDTFAIMYGEMAEGGIGNFLKGVAETLTNVSRNWKVLMPMLLAGGGAFAIQKLAVAALNHELLMQERTLGKNALATSKYSIAQLRAIATTGRWTLALMGLGRAMASIGKFIFNPITLGFAAVEGLIYLWRRHNQEMEKAAELSKSFKLTGSEGSRNLVSQIAGITPYSEGMGESALKSGIDQMTESLKNYGINKSKIFEDAHIDKETGKVRSLGGQYQYLANQLEHTKRVYDEMERTSGAFEFGIKESDGGWFDDSVETDLNDYAKALKTFQEKVISYTSENEEAVKKFIDSIRKQDASFANATSGMKSYAEMLEYLITHQKDFADSYAQFKTFGVTYGTGALPGLWSQVGIQKDEAMNELESFMNGVENFLKRKGYDFAEGGKNLTQEQIDNLLKQTRDWMEKHPEWENIESDIKNKINQRWPAIKIPMEWDTEEVEKQLDPWQQQMQDWLDKNKLKLKITPDMRRQDVIDMVDQAMKEAQAAIDQTKPILLRFGVDLSNVPNSDNLPKGLQTPWGQKQAEDYRTASTTATLINSFRKEFGLPKPKRETKKTKKTNETDKELETWRKRISLLEKYRQEVETLETMMTHADAVAKLRADGNFAPLWDYFTNPEDYKGSLSEAANKLGTKGKRKEFVDELGAKQGAEDLRKFKKETEDAVSELGRMLDIMQENYNIYKEWVDLTGDENIASMVAGVTKNSSYADLLKDQYRKLGGANGKSAESFFGLSESEAKKFGEKSGLYKLWQEWQENNKKIKADNIKLYADAIRDAKGYEEKVADVNRNLQKQLDAIEKLAASPEEKARLKKNATDKANEEIAGLTWDNFKKTEEWGRVFADLDRMSTGTLRRMIDQLKAILPNIKGNVQAVKELYSAMDKMEKEVASRKPFEVIQSSLKNRSTLSKYYKQAQSSGSVTADERLASLLGVDVGTSVTKERIKDEMESEERDFMNAIDQIIDGLNTFKNGLDLVSNLFDSLGMTGAANSASDAAGLIGGALSGASSLSSLGPWGMAAGAVLGLATGIFQLHDKGIQRQIEAIQDEVDALESNTEAIKRFRERTLGYDMGELRRQMANMYNDTTRRGEATAFNGQKITYSYDSDAMRAMREYYRENSLGNGYAQEFKNLQKQRDDYMSMYELENSKKKKSQESLDEYKEKIAELDEQIAYFAQDMVDELYGINLKDWADQIGDALMTAFENGEDAAEAFNNTVQDIMRQVSRKMLSIGIIQPMMERLQKKLFGENGKGGSFDATNPEGTIDAAMRDIMTFFGEGGEGQQMIKATQLFYEKWEGFMKSKGLTLEDTGSSSSSSASIKSITEEAFGLFTSYINGMRQDLSVNRAVIAQYFPMFYQALTSGNASLRNIENHTDAIMRSNEIIASKVTSLDNSINGLRTQTWRVPMA